MRGALSLVRRAAGRILRTEKARFARQWLATHHDNRQFRLANPGVPMPPLYALWDAQAHTSYATYWRSGLNAAAVYWRLIFESGIAPFRILDWGCGPARIVRHLPRLASQVGVKAEFYGSDYNRTSIEWASRNILDVRFALNGLAPPLPFPSGHFDFMYCRSVFTHLSEAMHFAWIKELRRVTRQGGIICISTAGLEHAHRMTPAERARFDNGELVTRVRGYEGKRDFAVFHPHQFVREKLLADLEILRHDTPQKTQELWLARRI